MAATISVIHTVYYTLALTLKTQKQAWLPCHTLALHRKSLTSRVGVRPGLARRARRVPCQEGAGKAGFTCQQVLILLYRNAKNSSQRFVLHSAHAK